MPTSSIFTTVRITDPERIEAFFNAMDEAADSPMYTEIEPTHSLVTDPKKLRRMLAKRFPEEFDEGEVDEADEEAEDEANEVKFAAADATVSDSIRKEIAIRLLGKLSLEEIAEAVKLDIETVRELAEVDKAG